MEEYQFSDGLDFHSFADRILSSSRVILVIELVISSSLDL